MLRILLVTCLFALASTSVALAQTAEVCGNGVDDDGDGFSDESCYPGLTSSLVDSPLSTRDTGLISPSTGSLHYRLPPDISPRVPYGPSLAFQRTYASKIDPGASAPAWKKPLGDRWIHNFMGWIHDYGTSMVIRLLTGQEITAVFVSGCNYATRGGQATKGLVHCAGSGYTLTLLDGSSLSYAAQGGSGGVAMLTRISDPGSSFTGGQVSISYSGITNQVTSVYDASGNRSLVFNYTGNVLTSVQFQIWGTTYHTTSYAYAGSNLTTVTIGSQLAQTNVYTSNYLTKIQDGAANSIVSFAYDAATAGKVVRVDTVRGMVGFEINSPRTNCSGKTVMYFNRGNALSCNVDADCGAGFLCGGKTGAGSAGQCFRGARCLTVDTTAGHHEDLVTGVTALGPPGESCDGACLDVAQYLWDNSTKYVASLGIQDPSGNYSVRSVNSNGLPTRITYGDPDSNATNGNAAREVYLTYGDSNFPGRVTEIRRKSDLSTVGRCDPPPAAQDGCQVTTITWNVFYGKPSQVHGFGSTLDSTGAVTTYNFDTLYTYNAYGRLTQIDGPLATTDDVTVFEYYPILNVDPMKEGFLQNLKRKKNATEYVTSSALAFDFWGNATTLQAPDDSLTCLTFSSARGHLTQSREAMAGQTDCSTSNGADLITSFTRDSALRLTQLTRPDNSCIFYEYDTKGRLLRTKRRDDCNAASAGDKQEYVYDSEGLVTEIQTYDSASVLTSKQPFTYFDSRRLQRVVNPVDTSKWTGLTYDARGLVTQIDAAGNLGKTMLHRDNLPRNTANDGRVTSVDRYKTSTVFDTWNLLYDWIGNQKQVKDGDDKATDTVRDDLGRTVKLISPDMSFPTLFVYDEASRLVTQVDALGGGPAQQTHSFTYDHLGRQLTADYWGTCDPTGASQIEITRSFDALPVGGPPCPTGMTCSRLAGHLAWVEVGLMCTASQTDGALEQQTFYAYDDAGRLIREYVRDDAASPRIADDQYQWTKNGSLSQVTLPSTAVMGATFGSAGNNSDSDLVTAVWRTNTSTPIADAITWFPYGPLKQYNQKNQIGGALQRTRITRNLAYRITGMFLEPQAGGAANFSVALGEDAKGRIIKRDYSAAAAGVQNSYFLYDDQDRVTCETATLVGSCPTSGTDLKNNQVLGFTNAGDWIRVLRPIPGSTNGFTNTFNPSGYGTSHQILFVTQSDGSPILGDTSFGYDTRGNRSFDDNITALTNDRRDYTYDARGNLVNVHGKYFTGGVWHDYDVTSAFDADNRRVFKSFFDNATGVQAQWFFYYDAADRLTEIRYTPNIASPSTYTVYQLAWLGDRLVLYWQTDFPASTTTKRYVDTDETARPLEMWTWPASGDGTRVWAVNPNAWGFDKNVVGPTVFQPLVFAGQFRDSETTALQNDGATVHRSGLVLNGFRTYDPFTGSYLQMDPLAPQTWSSYVYVDSDPVGKRDALGLCAGGDEICVHKGGEDTGADPGGGGQGGGGEGFFDSWPGCPECGAGAPGGWLPPGGHMGGWGGEPNWGGGGTHGWGGASGAGPGTKKPSRPSHADWSIVGMGATGKPGRTCVPPLNSDCQDCANQCVSFAQRTKIACIVSPFVPTVLQDASGKNLVDQWGCDEDSFSLAYNACARNFCEFTEQCLGPNGGCIPAMP
jgi:RHS repeat-associated protein